MKIRTFLISMMVILAAEIISIIVFCTKDTIRLQDAVVVNEIVKSVEDDWNNIENHRNKTSVNYVVLDSQERVVFRTKEGLSESLNRAVVHRDTIVDVEIAGAYAGKVLIYNDSIQYMQQQKQKIVISMAIAIAVQFFVFILYIFYVKKVIIKPFEKLKGFARCIAGGNLDIPLEMDRQNLFGAFTESFDIMRVELKKAWLAEAEANAGKKELVAKLSHDIKTPVASIKAASEVGAALTDNERIKDNYNQIIFKADQINTLITNLFTATLEELKHLTVTPEDMDSRELKILLENSDYLHLGVVPDIPACLVYADKLRLQQVFDNIFSNSYKYAGTKIDVVVRREDSFIVIVIEDYGGGVKEEELPLLKKKFKRGSNAKALEGAGLGLYISDYFIKEMQGKMDVQNSENGLMVTVKIALSGGI